MPARAISRCSRVAGCPSGRCHACWKGSDMRAIPDTLGAEAPKERNKKGWGGAHLLEGNYEVAGLARAGVPRGMMFQHNIVALQHHQCLSVQGRRTGPGPLRHSEAQLSSIGGHLEQGWTGLEREASVGPRCL